MKLAKSLLPPLVSDIHLPTILSNILAQIKENSSSLKKDKLFFSIWAKSLADPYRLPLTT